MTGRPAREGPPPALEPLRPFFPSRAGGAEIPLPPPLDRLVGPFRLPAAPGGWVMSNFASTLDGVVVLDRDRSGGGAEITGGLREDRMGMGLLRALADVVVVGAGTLRAVPRHRWTPGAIFSELGEAYRALRRTLGLAPEPLNAIVTARGELSPDRPLFTQGSVPVSLVTTEVGARALRREEWPPHVEIRVAGRGDRLTPQEILASVGGAGPSGRVLLEGGPHLLAQFVRARALDELFLTVAPRVAGRFPGDRRLALLEQEEMMPEPARGLELVEGRRVRGYLFLRYRCARSRTAPGPP